ncbi:MAG: hypothetical protein ABIK86_03020 [candidate division WOR-3 bacterium]
MLRSETAVYVCTMAASNLTGQWLFATNPIICCQPGASGPGRQSVVFAAATCFRVSTRQDHEEES